MLPASIILENVSFTYPDESTPTLKNINLTIHAGEHIALVGASGAGKTTLANLLLGFTHPSSGRIHLAEDRSGIRSLSSARIAWVPQRPHLFHDTLAANIKLGRPDASEGEMIGAARTAHLDGFIQSLPEGYETVIGEGGARLSGGQAQRLALARALLMEAPILILDEPTSSLDPETETLLDELTRLLMKGKTVITIAHRLNTVFHADRIIVLDQGVIIETGTHRELLAQNGAYSRMVNAGDGTAAQGEAGERKKEGRGKKVVGEEDIRAGPHGTVDLVPAHQPPQWKSADQPSILLRLFSFLQGSWSLVGLSALLGAFTIGASVALMGTSAWLISTAALHPSIADLGVSIVGVRFFGISRGVFRYLERLVSHNVTFRLLARLRTWFYEKLEPLAPARLMEQRAGDLLARIIGDVETLENFYVRIVSPPLTAILVGLVTVLYLASHHPMLGLSLTGFFLTLGLLLPLLARGIKPPPRDRPGPTTRGPADPPGGQHPGTGGHPRFRPRPGPTGAHRGHRGGLRSIAKTHGAPDGHAIGSFGTADQFGDVDRAQPVHPHGVQR